MRSKHCYVLFILIDNIVYSLNFNLEIYPEVIDIHNCKDTVSDKNILKNNHML